MSFFDKIKKNLSVRRYLSFGALVLVGLAMIAFGIFLIAIDNKEEGIRVAVRGIESVGITFSYTVFGLILGVGGVVFCVIMIRQLLKELSEDNEYDKMMKKVKSAGDPDEIGNIIGALKKNPNPSKGDLRFNSEYLFYKNGTSLYFADKKDIAKVKPTSFKDKNGRYRDGISFEKIWGIYEFDNELRLLLIPYIQKIEITLRCRLSNYFCKKYGVLGYLSSDNRV